MIRRFQIIYVILFYIWSVEGAIHRVTHDDSSIQYLPTVCDLDCNRVCRNKWWLSCLSDGSASHRTKGNGTSSNFSFQGSGVTLYTRTAPDGGKAVIYIDGGDPQSIDTNSPVTNEANPLYSKSGLDATKTHTISVVYDVQAFTESVERFVDVRYFDYDDGSGGSGGSSSSSSPSPVASSDTSRTSNTDTSSSGSTNTAASGSRTTSNTAQTSSSRTGTVFSPILVTFSDGSVHTSSVAVPNSVSTGDSSSKKNDLSTRSIVGIVLGSIALASVILLCLFLIYRRQRRRRNQISEFKAKIGESYDFPPINNAERIQGEPLDNARARRSPPLHPYSLDGHHHPDGPDTPSNSNPAIQLYPLSNQRGAQQDTRQSSPLANSSKYNLHRAARPEPVAETIITDDDISESAVSPTIGSSSASQRQSETHPSALWGRLLNQQAALSSRAAGTAGTYGEKGTRFSSPPSGIQDRPEANRQSTYGYGSEVTTSTRSPPTPPPQYTR